ncbi:hypothetical protein [uncultured Phenylobacterium sp.]|uniref:hypothetical protein n=1 Tax=uncultured Phenylobacterium sp. TaxID=349273 RepID=UPI0025D350EE|nr:hypothetical protein [uncultured Phenylobacterium sp.]
MAAAVLDWLERLLSPEKKPPAAPSWFNQQIELAKWLVALGSGLTAFGFSALKDEPVAAQLILLQWAGGLLLASSALALLFILNSHAYERLREQGAVPGGSALRGPDLLRKLTYPLMMLTFIAGNAVFLFFAQGHLAALASAPVPAPIVSVADGPAGPMLFAQRGEQLWVLRGSDPVAARWEPLHTVPPSKPTARVKP